MTSFSSEEVDLIQLFRSRIADILPNDEFSGRDDSLIRWIRARDQDLEKAEDMFRNSMKWRTENNIDSILENGIDKDIQERFPFYVDGFDKAGRPIATMPYGEWDVRSFIEEEGPTRFFRYSNQFLETILAALKKTTAELYKDKHDSCVQFVMICNMSGYTYRQLANVKAVQSLIQTVSVFEAHYPETLGNCIVINAPAIFSILFGMMKPFMSSRTIDKFKIFPEDKNKWLPAVEELIEPTQIRKQFGGTKD